jgi:hypothetical protein
MGQGYGAGCLRAIPEESLIPPVGGSLEKMSMEFHDLAVGSKDAVKVAG